MSHLHFKFIPKINSQPSPTPAPNSRGRPCATGCDKYGQKLDTSVGRRQNAIFQPALTC